jgi:hypothetical protein
MAAFFFIPRVDCRLVAAFGQERTCQSLSHILFLPTGAIHHQKY